MTGPQDGVSDDYVRIREQVLGLTAETLTAKQLAGVDLQPGDVLAAMMEFPLSTSVVSLVCVVDDTVSLYFSTGRCMTGLGEHEQVALAATGFLIEATAASDALESVDAVPLPGPGDVRLTLVTSEQRLSAVVPRDVLAADIEHPLAKFEGAGQNVLTAIREATT